MTGSATMKKSILLLLLSFFYLGSGYAQQNSVSGIVTSADDSNPLPGVNITVKGTSTGTSSDANGHYSLSVPDTVNTLVFSFVGFETQEIAINSRSEVNVEMRSATVAGEELVVVGYGTMQKSDLTGSVSSVKGDAITAPAVSNPAQALQGASSGVQVVSSGDPGASPSINIRGISTTGDSSPLFVVDGLMVDDMSYLNSNDIESIEVLKDASATAIYGSRGANGVVLITTKQGESSKPEFSLTMSEGIEKPHSYSMVNAWEYATLMNEGLENAGEQPAYDLDEIDSSTSWFDEVLNPGTVRNYNLSFSQGTESASYYVSVGMHNQTGVVDKSGYERYTVRLNNQYELSENVSIGHNFSGNWTHKNNRYGAAFEHTYRIPPTIPVYNSDGSYTDTDNESHANVIAGIDYHNNFTKTRSLVGNAYVDVDFLNNFHFRSSLGLDIRNSKNTNFNPAFFVSESHKNEVSSLSKNWVTTQNWLWENTINYDQIFGVHSIDAVIGFTAQENNFESLSGNRQHIFGNERNLWYLDAGDKEGLGNSNIAVSSGIVSYLSRVNYTLMDRYLLTGTMRIDGSSKFSKNDRWGYFPSVAAGWRVSEEPFMQNVDWLSELKFRGSWGQLGNEKIGNYRYFATAATGMWHAGIFNDQVDPGATVTTLINKNITWETSEQLDVGFEFGLLDDRITAEVDWYKRTTKDMLVEVGVPLSVGLGATEGNVGSVENTGFDLKLDFRGSGGGFHYNIGLTASTINNEVLDLGTLEEIPGGNIGAGVSVSRAKVGRPIGYFYGYKSLGPFDTQEEINAHAEQSNVEPGDLKMKDINNDGVIDAEDRTMIGSPIPDATGGLNIQVGYKSFELTVDMYGSFGGEIYDASNNTRYSGEDNFSREWLDRWTGPGTSDRIPRVTFGGDWNYEPSTRWVHDGTYVKLQNVKLQYTVPSPVLERLPISKARLHISGNNLHYFTKYSGFTPEFASNDAMNAGIDGSVYPVSSFYTLGATINF